MKFWTGWFQDETTRDQEKQQYLNIYAFIAKLSANSTVEPPAYQFPRCLANLRNALESQPWTVDLKGTEYEGFRNEYSSVRTYLAVELPPAVQWILHAGQWIWQGSKGDWHWWEETALDWSEFDTWDGFPWPREWKGHLGFSRERWAFWKERFTAITELAEIDDDTRQLAAQGFEAMQRFETA